MHIHILAYKQYVRHSMGIQVVLCISVDVPNACVGVTPLCPSRTSRLEKKVGKNDGSVRGEAYFQQQPQCLCGLLSLLCAAMRAQ